VSTKRPGAWVTVTSKSTGRNVFDVLVTSEQMSSILYNKVQHIIRRYVNGRNSGAEAGRATD
jgi:hypothetical protein